MSGLYSNSRNFVIPVYIFNGRKQTLVDMIGILSALRMRGCMTSAISWPNCVFAVARISQSDIQILFIEISGKHMFFLFFKDYLLPKRESLYILRSFKSSLWSSFTNIFLIKGHIIGCPAEHCERMCRFAENSSFCQAHAFEVLTPTSTYRQFTICMFYFLKCHTKQDIVFKYHILQFYLYSQLCLCRTRISRIIA